MKLEVEAYDCLCELCFFKINGIEAYKEDFGDNCNQGVDDDYEYDEYDDDILEWGCANMQFEAYAPRKEVLDKYGITKEEYHEVCERLDRELSFGRCGWCM